MLNQDEKIKLSIVCLQGCTQPDSEMQKWMEDRYKLDIDIIALPGWSDAASKISLLMGDETQRPDIIWWWNMEADYTKWVDAGLLVDVSPYMKKYTNMVDYHNSVDPGVMFYASGDFFSAGAFFMVCVLQRAASGRFCGWQAFAKGLFFCLTEKEKNGNIEAKLGKRQRRGILHGASESRKLLGDAKQQTNPVELTSEPLLPNLKSKSRCRRKPTVRGAGYADESSVSAECTEKISVKQEWYRVR